MADHSKTKNDTAQGTCGCTTGGTCTCRPGACNCGPDCSCKDKARTSKAGMP